MTPTDGTEMSPTDGTEMSPTDGTEMSPTDGTEIARPDQAASSDLLLGSAALGPLQSMLPGRSGSRTLRSLAGRPRLVMRRGPGWSPSCSTELGHEKVDVLGISWGGVWPSRSPPSSTAAAAGSSWSPPRPVR